MVRRGLNVHLINFTTELTNLKVNAFTMDVIPSTLLAISLVCAQVCCAHVDAPNLGLFDSEKRISRTTRGVPTQCGVKFVFERFAKGNGMNRTQMNTLMKQLGIGNSMAKGRNNNCNKCVTADEVFMQNGYENTQFLNRTSFESVCPSLLQQIILKSCESKTINVMRKVSQGKVSSAKAWGFGILSVTIISMASMLGAFVVPFMNKAFYKKLLLFMVSLAVGVLGGSGIFHLIPHTFGFGTDGSLDYLWKCSVIVGGIYFFFITESLMKIYIRFSEWQKQKRNRVNVSVDCKRLDFNEIDADHCHIVMNGDDVHKDHALDSVHVSDQNCQHEHGVDSLNLAGDHCINKKNTSEFFKDSDSNQGVSFFTRVAPVAWMIILGDGLHNFIDGLAIGVSFTNNIVEGISTSLAIFCEELPHELGDFAILLNSGLTYKQAILANFLSACTCYIGMIIGTILGSTTQIVKWIYALAAGMFLYISLVDMLPEATGMQVTISSNSKKETLRNFIIVNFGIILGYSLMLLLAIYAGDISI